MGNVNLISGDDPPLFIILFMVNKHSYNTFKYDIIHEKTKREEQVMKTNPLTRKGITVSIVALLLTLALIPNTHAYSNAQRMIIKKSSPEETEIVTCRFFTLNGIEEVEKEVTIEDATYLFQLLNEPNTVAIASELNNLGLLPDNIDVKLAKDLINGEYDKRQLNRIGWSSKEMSNFAGDNPIQRNFLCNVNGDARDYYYFTPKSIALYISGFASMILDGFLREFSWYPTWETWWGGYIGPLFILGVLGAILPQVFPFIRINPFRAVPCILANIYDGPWEVPAHLNTTGPYGNWTIESFDIDFMMIGFFGLWISRWDSQNEPNCKFMGYSLYTAGKPTDLEPKDGEK